MIDEARKTVAISGGFDPIHVGHVRLIRAAAKLGNRLVVILNNDGFLMRKKGYVFMPLEERKEILESIQGVTKVVVAVDIDQSVNETLKIVKPDIFATGGDVTLEKVREKETCAELGIKILLLVGGNKVQSSQWLTDRVKAKD